MKNLLSVLQAGGTFPDQVLLGEYPSTWFNCLWRLSLICPIREHGASLARSNISLTIICARPGENATFHLCSEEMNAESFLGYFHTHPYKSGTSGVAFSSADLVVVINSPMKICIVQSGVYRFMVVRSMETPDFVAFNTLSNLFEDRFKYYYVGRRKKFQTSVLLTNLDVCREYGLAFYQGKVGEPLRLSPGGDIYVVARQI